jgi:hypothetical protein
MSEFFSVLLNNSLVRAKQKKNSVWFQMVDRSVSAFNPFGWFAFDQYEDLK